MPRIGSFINYYRSIAVIPRVTIRTNRRTSKKCADGGEAKKQGGENWSRLRDARSTAQVSTIYKFTFIHGRRQQRCPRRWQSPVPDCQLTFNDFNGYVPRDRGAAFGRLRTDSDGKWLVSFKQCNVIRLTTFFTVTVSFWLKIPTYLNLRAGKSIFNDHFVTG